LERQLQYDSVIPLYHQLKEFLREDLETGVSKPGDMVPSEHQLMQQYKVSRNTVKKALEDLVQEGMLYRVQGKGTFVARPKLEQSLSGFYSFSKVMKAIGIQPKDVILSFRETQATSRVARNLQIPAGTDVYELKRLRYAEEDPIIFETSYIPKQITPGLSEEKLQKSSLYDLMGTEYDVVVSRAKESFEPVLINDYEEQYLNVKKGYPALLLDRVAYDLAGRPVEYCRSTVRGDRCRFYTELL